MKPIKRKNVVISALVALIVAALSFAAINFYHGAAIANEEGLLSEALFTGGVVGGLAFLGVLMMLELAFQRPED